MRDRSKVSSFSNSLQNTLNKNKENCTPNQMILKHSRFAHLLNQHSNSRQKSHDKLSLMLNTIRNKYNILKETNQKLEKKPEQSSLESLNLHQFFRTNFSDISLNEAIEICEENAIYSREDLSRIHTEAKQPHSIKSNSRNSSQLKRRLCTQYGQMKIEQLINRLKSDEQLPSADMDIIQLLCPKQEEISVEIVRASYEQLLKQQQLKQQQNKKIKHKYQETIQKKIRTILENDQLLAVKFQKKVRQHRIGRKSMNKITFTQLSKLLKTFFKLDDQEILLTFRYVLLVDNNQYEQLVDRSKTVDIVTLYKILTKSNCFSDKQFQQTNSSQLYYRKSKEYQNIIHEFAIQKQELLSQIYHKQQQIQKYKKIVNLQQLEMKEISNVYQQQIQMLKQAHLTAIQNQVHKWKNQADNNARLAQWYRQQLQHTVNNLSTKNACFQKY